MTGLSDIYVISSKRDVKTIYSFLDHFLPEREESADDYYVPEYSNNPQQIFTKDAEIISFCVENNQIEQCIYWRAINNKPPEHAHIFFLNDGNIIFGLSTDSSNQEYAIKLLNKVKLFLDEQYGYITFETPPNAHNYDEFMAQINDINP